MSLLERGALSVRETAKYLSLGRTTVYALINSGELATIKLGRRRLIKTESINAWLIAQSQKEAAQ